jgi:hypothetical protein
MDPSEFKFEIPRIPESLTRPISIPNIRSPLVTTLEENLASAFYKRLATWISQYDAALDPEHEVGVRLVSFGQSVVFKLVDMSYWNPSLIRFDGVKDDGSPISLVQHVSQISILLTTLPRKDPSKEKKPFGFAAPESGE